MAFIVVTAVTNSGRAVVLATVVLAAIVPTVFNSNTVSDSPNSCSQQ